MNITFIFGNGFDIQLGLASRYSDFLLNYTMRLGSSDSKNIKEFKEYLQSADGQELWADAEKAMGIHLQDFNDDTIGNYHERIEDFETQIIEYLESQQARCNYVEKEEIARIFWEFITSSFYDVLNGRAKDFGNVGVGNRYHLITFNYTNVLDNVASCCHDYDPITDNYLDDVCHIHGTLDTQIIMGVNDKSQLDLRGGVTLTSLIEEELIKPQMNSRLDSKSKAEKMITDSDIIYTYGISYGETDKVWWDRISKWLRASRDHKLVVFIKDPSKKISPKIPWMLNTYEHRMRENILKKLGIMRFNGDYGRLLEQVYIILNTERLNLKEILLSTISGAASR